LPRWGKTEMVKLIFYRYKPSTMANGYKLYQISVSEISIIFYRATIKLNQKEDVKKKINQKVRKIKKNRILLQP